MPRKILVSLLGLALFLSACQGSTTSPPVQVTPTLSRTEQPTTAPQIAFPTITGEVASVSMRGCTVASPRPTSGPTEQSLFPPVGPEDWTQGPQSAKVTIIEYSDFQ